MSYILDALRKSEQQRQRVQTPFLYTAQLSTGSEKQPPFLLYGIVAGVLVSAGILAGWMHPWQQARPDKVAETVHASPYVAPAHRAEPVKAAPVEAARPAPAHMDPPKSAPVVREALALPVQNVEPPQKVAATTVRAPGHPDRLYALSELPPAIQQEIPPMSISGYVDSITPEDRTVGINNRLLQEGDYLAPGLKLEQISSNGLVFSYKNYKFRQGLR